MEKIYISLFKPILLKIKAIWEMSRLAPALAWSATSIILGLGSAFSLSTNINWWQLSLIFFSGLCLHSITAHGCNDLEDWRSGTDQASQGVLSGGSGVLKNGLLSERQVWLISLAGVLPPAIATFYLSKQVGPFVFLLLFVGIWSAFTYTIPPFRFSYRPLLGEWLSAYPTILCLTIGTFFIQTGTVSASVATAGVIHGFLSLGWVMQHHLPDIPSDLAANPQKLTTPAFVSRRWGLTKAYLVPAGYFIMAALSAVAAGLLIDQIFLIALPCAVLCIYQAVKTNPLDVASITAREKMMMLFTSTHALLLAALLGLGL